MLDLIIEHLRDIDPHSINALALVCSALLANARYVQLRDRLWLTLMYHCDGNTPTSATAIDLSRAAIGDFIN